MTNFEAIRRMSPAEMAALLDAVCLTGYHNASYASRLPDEEQFNIMDEFPYDEDWLNGKAEDATAHIFTVDEEGNADQNLPAALARAILRNAGIDPNKEINDES